MYDKDKNTAEKISNQYMCSICIKVRIVLWPPKRSVLCRPTSSAKLNLKTTETQEVVISLTPMRFLTSCVSGCKRKMSFAHVYYFTFKHQYFLALEGCMICNKVFIIDQLVIDFWSSNYFSFAWKWSQLLTLLLDLKLGP